VIHVIEVGGNVGFNHPTITSLAQPFDWRLNDLTGGRPE